MKNILKKVWDAVKLNKEKSLGVIRHILTFGGGLLITKGLIDESVWVEISGFIITLFGILWSISDKK